MKTVIKNNTPVQELIIHKTMTNKTYYKEKSINKKLKIFKKILSK